MRCAIFAVSLVLCSCLLAVEAAKPDCDPHCIGNCNNAGVGKCDNKCEKGYLLDSTSKTCSTIGSCANDRNCIRCTASGYCYLCAIGYKLNDALQCVARTDECDRFCTSDCTQGIGKCDSACQRGYKLNTDTYNCEGCDPNCDLSSGCETNGAGFCDSACMDGYSLKESTHRCIQCDMQCASGCDVKGEARCDSECKPGYALDTTTYWTCVKCDENCAGTCSTPSTCDSECKEGYALITRGGFSTCDACDPNCASGCSVQKAGKCDTACKPNFTLRSNTCRPCSSNCGGSCDTSGPGHCDFPCAANYFHDNTVNACYPCDKHCASGRCNSRGTCAGSCEDGYRLVDERCQ